MSRSRQTEKRSRNSRSGDVAGSSATRGSPGKSEEPKSANSGNATNGDLVQRSIDDVKPGSVDSSKREEVERRYYLASANVARLVAQDGGRSSISSMVDQAAKLGADELVGFLNFHSNLLVARYLRSKFSGSLNDFELWDVYNGALRKLHEWVSQPDFRPVNTLRAVFTTAAQEASDFLRKRKRDREPSGQGNTDDGNQVIDTLAAQQVEADSGLLVSELGLALREIIDDLPKQEKKVIEAFFEVGFHESTEDLAARLGMTQKSIPVTRFRARKKIFQQLQIRGFPADLWKKRFGDPE